MSLIEAINDLKKVTRNRVIIINVKSSKYQKELDKLGIKKINLSIELSKLVDGLSDEEKKMEGADILKKYLEEENGEIIALDNVSYSFSPELGKINLVETLNYYSRDNQIIILLIDGKLSGNNLIYSSIENKNYIEMDVSKNKYLLGWEDED